MTLLAALTVVALGLAFASLMRLSRAQKTLPPVEERTFKNLRAGDVVITPRGEFLVDALGTVGPARLVTLVSGREKKFLLVPEGGPLGFFGEAPDSAADLDRELARTGGQKLDRATVELLPGA